MIKVVIIMIGARYLLLKMEETFWEFGPAGRSSYHVARRCRSSSVV